MLVLMDKPSSTGRELEKALRRELGEVGVETFPLKVNWTGKMVIQPFPVLNSQSRSDKLAQLTWLELNGVRVPKFSLAPQPNWLGRTIFHQRSRDFRQKVDPDFWTEYTPVEEEWRLHFFRSKKGNLRLLRSGIKVPKPGANPLFRGHSLGWRISYTGGAPEVLRTSARRAVDALQLDFGAVDIGFTPGEEPVIFEVNTCPGLDSGTLELYVQNILERGAL